MANNITYQDVAERILELLGSGIYPPGSRLPEQKDLAQALSVSRMKIREALIALEVLGCVECRGHQGTYVIDIDSIPLKGAPKVTPLELTEARALFEAESAALAAPIITEETISELKKYISIMSGVKDNEMSPDDADAAFHKAIARSTNNKMIIFIIESMWKIRTHNLELQKVYREVCTRDSLHREQEHLEILYALEKRDPTAARKAMRAHFTTILQALLDISEEDAYREIQLQASKNRSRFLLSKVVAS